MLNPISGIEISRRLKYNTKTMLSDRHFTDYEGLLGVRTQNKKSEGSYIPVPLAFSVDVGPVRGRVVAVSPSIAWSRSTCPPRGPSWWVRGVTYGGLFRHMLWLLSLVLLSLALLRDVGGRARQLFCWA